MNGKYLRLMVFKLGPGQRAKAASLVEQFAPAISGRPGFARATFFGDDASGEYGVAVLWESREAAEQAFEALFPRLQQALAGAVSEPPRHPLYEVVREVEGSAAPQPQAVTSSTSGAR